MNSKCMIAAFCIVGVAIGAVADDENKPDSKSGTAVEKEKSDSFPVSVEASIAYDSKFMSYGLVDGKNPIMTPAAGITFFDLLKFDMSWLMDTTHYSRKLGIGNRQWQYWELDAGVSLNHKFDAEDIDWLPTSVEMGVGYMYEYHPRRAKCKTDYVNGNPDTQFITLEAGLPDLWFEPVLSYERDIMRDDGTYVNLEVGHEFGLVDAGEDEDPLLGIDLRLAQGFGNSQRVKGYLSKHKTDWEDPLNHSGLMDTQLTLTLNYRPFGWLTISPYIAYVDFLFDSQIRDEARWYEPGNTGGQESDTSWHVLWGICAAASF